MEIFLDSVPFAVQEKQEKILFKEIDWLKL